MKHVSFGLAAAALASSVLALDVAYYPTVATAALLGLFAVWLFVTVRDARSKGGVR
ncbi:hypothetical protein [Nocardiopsis halophila]|uniref:hypothetical protein n=1 Tax=Nocardiopsis halophila TaxID=141692 RepID=UPI00034D45C6|nr:hypothetical protein [Nocardiopsis halophila]